MKKPRLLALDIDGTLLDDEKRLPPENRDALQRAARESIVIAIASGRMTCRVEAVEHLLGIDCVLIAYNGAHVVGRRAEGRSTISHRPVPPDVAELFINFSLKEGYLLNFYHEDRLYAENGPEHARFRDLYTTRTGAEYHLVEDIRSFLGVSPTKLIVMAERDERDRLHDAFRAELQNRAFITKSEPEYLEVMAPNVDKGTALQTVSRHYGFDSAETLAIGDSDNDLELLRAAGWGVAMANSPPHVQAAAKAVAERTNNEAGVAEIVERWALS